ncbi:MAG: ExbD/TolR family protein [Erythrobacter sp.]|jgi:biopolymer transport protein TolR|nr:ExbD/TolR family protein [Erythrobacter sp.]
MAMSLSSRRSRRASRRAPMAEINVTPFVDVMLVLLIIFMVTAPLLAVGVPIELPDSRANPVEQTPDQITITLDDDGLIYIEGQRIEPGGFAAALDTIVAENAASLPIVTFRADTSLDYGRAMAALGELNRAGFTSISLVTSGSGAQP